MLSISHSCEVEQRKKMMHKPAPRHFPVTPLILASILAAMGAAVIGCSESDDSTSGEAGTGGAGAAQMVSLDATRVPSGSERSRVESAHRTTPSGLVVQTIP